MSTPEQIDNIETTNSVTRDIDIQVTTEYIEEQSQPESDRFVFAYTITIRNQGSEQVQLLSRYWRIQDGNEQVHEVEGEGVVGQKPVLAPGQEFTYTSGTAIATPVGNMQGHYIFEKEDGTKMTAPIACFRLAHSAMIH